MIAFWTIGALLIVLALAVILPPLFHPDRIAAATTMAVANVAVYRHQLAEMESDRRDGVVTAEQFLADREDLEQRLIDDVPNRGRGDRKARPEPSSGWLIGLLVLGLPMMTALLYLVLGTPP